MTMQLWMSAILTCLIFTGLPSVAQTPSMAKLQIQLNKNPDNMTVRSQLAEQYYQKKNFNKVIELLNPYSEQIPIPSYLVLAGAYSELNKHDQEVRVLNIVVNKDKDNHQSHYILGNAYVQWEKQTEDLSRKKEIRTKAISSLRQSISLNKKFKPSYDLLLNLFIANGENYEARTLLNDMIQQFGKRPGFLNDKCRLLTLDGYLNQAVEECKKAILASKKYPDNYVYLAQAYFDKGEEKRSERMLKIAAKRFPKSEPAQWAAGEFYQKKKNYPVSNRYFGAAVKADPSSLRAHRSYATTLMEVDQPEKALKHFIAACKKNPNVRSDIATAAAKLRLKKNYSLSKKFMSAKYKCQ